MRRELSGIAILVVGMLGFSQNFLWIRDGVNEVGKIAGNKVASDVQKASTPKPTPSPKR